MDYKLLGKNIRKYRKQKGLRQEELAEMVGCTSSHIGHIENARGIPSLSLIHISYEVAEKTIFVPKTQKVLVSHA